MPDDLQKVKDDRDATINRLEKEIAELQKKKILTKMSAIEEYKSFDGFHEAVVQATSKYFGEGFDLCKKQIGLLHPELDIQSLEIDDELAREEDESEDKKVEEEKEDEREGGTSEQDNNPFLLEHLYFFLQWRSVTLSIFNE